MCSIVIKLAKIQSFKFQKEVEIKLIKSLKHKFYDISMREGGFK